MKSVLLALGLTLHCLPLSLIAAEPIDVEWNKVCQAASGHEMRVTTTAGDAVEGFCVKVDVNDISVSTHDHRVVKVAKSALARIDMRQAERHQFASLLRGMWGSFKWSAKEVLTPAAPLAITGVPATLAWGMLAALLSGWRPDGGAGRNARDPAKVVI